MATRNGMSSGKRRYEIRSDRGGNVVVGKCSTLIRREHSQGQRKNATKSRKCGP